MLDTINKNNMVDYDDLDEFTQLLADRAHATSPAQQAAHLYADDKSDKSVIEHLQYHTKLLHMLCNKLSISYKDASEPPEFATCKICKVTKPGHEYYATKSKKNGIFAHCKECHKSYVAERLAARLGGK